MTEASALANYVTLEALAGDFGVSIRTAERWVNNAVPGLPMTKVGQKRFVHRGDLEQWMAARRVQRNVKRGRP
ncbi:MAG: helix-turn-helix domain-containing protein [Devosia sp.]